MITDIFIYIIGSFVALVANAFVSIGTIFPTQILNAISSLFQYVNYLNGILPMDTIMLALSIYIKVAIFYYAVKLILFVFSLIPIIGKTVNLPRISETKSETTNMGTGARYVTKSRTERR